MPQRDAEKLKIGALWVRAHGHDAGRLGGGVSVCQGFLLSLCAKAFASAVTLLQDFLCLFIRLSSAFPPFAFVLCSSSPRSPILGGQNYLRDVENSD